MTERRQPIFFSKEINTKMPHAPTLSSLTLTCQKRMGRKCWLKLKSTRTLKTIPVVILTISKSEEDIIKTYKLHANCFITKPIDLNKFNEAIKTIEDFWLTLVKLPKS